jgi:CubicO group peptidase (beta-lactamase class C family)
MAEAAEQFGMSTERLAQIPTIMNAYIEKGRFYGGVILVARNGNVVLHEAVGYRDYENKVALEKNAVFSIFSMSKSLTGVLALNAIERGQFALTTKVCDVIPEFSGGVRENITFYHLLTHSSGLPISFTPVPGMYIDRFDEVIETICRKVHSEAPPGELVSYAPMVGHALLGESVRRTDPKGRTFRQIMEDGILKPLGMKDTAVGLRKDLRSRHIKPIWLFDKGGLNHLGHSNYGPDGAFEEEEAEMPWVGIASTVADIFRFAEMLRRGGELDGARILSPVTLDRTRINETGTKINPTARTRSPAAGSRRQPTSASGFLCVARRFVTTSSAHLPRRRLSGSTVRGVCSIGLTRSTR